MKKFFITTTLLLGTTTAYADLWDIFKPAPKVPAHAVESHHIHRAQCITEKLTRYGKSDEFYQGYFDKLKTGKTIKSSRIGKKTYTNEFQNIVDAYRFLTGYRTYRKNSYCETVECEIESLFGTSFAHKLMYLAQEFSFNASHLAIQKKGGASFSESELDIIIWSFEQLPKFMFPKSMKTLWKDMSDYTGGTYANVVGFMEKGTGNMTLFKKWARSRMETKAYTVIHEFGHFMGGKLSIHESREWVQFSNWDKVRGNEVNKSKNLISEYSRSNHIEDFAEAFSAYRMNPQVLKAKAPKKYELLKRMVFLEKEYVGSDCSSALIDKSFKAENVNFEGLVKSCEFPILGYRLGLKELSDTMSCLSENNNLLKLKSFDPPRSKYRSKVVENFNVRSYPFLSQEQREIFQNEIIKNLEPIRL